MDCDLKGNSAVRGVHGKVPVIFISLKGVDGLTFEDAYERLRLSFALRCHDWAFLLQSERAKEESNVHLNGF